jgi:uncharacterized protein
VGVVTSIDQQIARELGVREAQVSAAVELIDGGATVPFIARYRKEATGALDDAQLRTLDERLRYLRELEERRTVILNSIREQGKLDDALEAAIRAADSKGRLEDIYLPFKPKRRTKAEIAKQAGLEPLAELLLTQPTNDPQAAAARFVDAEKQVADVGRSPHLEGTRRQAGGGGEVQRLLRFRREPGKSAVAPRAGAVPRGKGGDPRRLDRVGESGDRLHRCKPL